MAKQFWTESCGDCSHLQWGRIEKFKFVEDGEGETPGCFSAELDSSYISACPLTPEDALEWWYSKRDPSSAFNRVCQNYDGQRPSKEKIEKEIRAQQTSQNTQTPSLENTIQNS